MLISYLAIGMLTSVIGYLTVSKDPETVGLSLMIWPLFWLVIIVYIVRYVAQKLGKVLVKWYGEVLEWIQ